MNAPQSFTDSFNKHADTMRQAAATQDQDDLQHAISGADVGRMRKHVRGDGLDSSTGKNRKDGSEGIHRTLEWLLLNDQNYARLYNTAKSAVSQVAQSTEETLTQALAKLEQAQAHIAEVLAKAAKLPDGRSVFRDEDGVIKDASGNVVAADIAAGIQWGGDEPSYENYRARVDRVEALEGAVNELRGIETELGGYQGEMADNDAPPSQERLEEITERSGDLRDRIDDIQIDLEQVNPSLIELEADTENLETSPRVATAIPTINLGG